MSMVVVLEQKVCTKITIA